MGRIRSKPRKMDPLRGNDDEMKEIKGGEERRIKGRKGRKK